MSAIHADSESHRSHGAGVLSNTSKRLYKFLPLIFCAAAALTAWIVFIKPRTYSFVLPSKVADCAESITASCEWVIDVGKQSEFYKSDRFELSSTELAQILGEVSANEPFKPHSGRIGATAGCAFQLFCPGGTEYTIVLQGGVGYPEYVYTYEVVNGSVVVSQEAKLAPESSEAFRLMMEIMAQRKIRYESGGRF